MREPYSMAHDCPECGEKDSEFEWKGARMWSSGWGHQFSCCSDECGKKLALMVDRLRKTKKGRKKLAELWEKCARQSHFVIGKNPWKCEC